MMMLRISTVGLAAALALSPAPSGAIVGGTTVADGEMPWVAAIYNSASPEAGQFCGGSLVAPRVVVTAAHCITLLLDDTLAQLPVDVLDLKVKVMLGRTRLGGTGGEQIAVARLHRHLSAPINDVAVLVLAEASSIAPVAYARPADAAFFAPGAIATIAGWGATSEGGSGSDRLLKASVSVMTDGRCADVYGPEYNGASMVCAGDPQGGTDTCQGDSGGPLTVAGPGGAPLLAGATSFGRGCGRADSPGVYAEIAAVADFLAQYA